MSKNTLCLSLFTDLRTGELHVKEAFEANVMPQNPNHVSVQLYDAPEDAHIHPINNWCALRQWSTNDIYLVWDSDREASGVKMSQPIIAFSANGSPFDGEKYYTLGQAFSGDMYFLKKAVEDLGATEDLTQSIVNIRNRLPMPQVPVQRFEAYA